MNDRQLLTPPDVLEALCEKYHIRKLSLFGSVLREDFNESSDIDVLVDFEKGHTPDFFALYDLEEELSQLFEHREIDLVTEPALNRHLREGILSQAVVQYAQR
jgi:hypothetical protein